MGSSNGKSCRRPNGVLKAKDVCSPLYALCGNKPSSVLYSKSLENCSLKLYRVDSDGDQDGVVVMLDCGGRVYANGKKVYPFDSNPPEAATEELNVSQIIGELSNGRIPDVFGKGGTLEKHLNPGDYAGALDSLLCVFAETFNQLLLDGLKMQDGMRSLEEEKTSLSLKVLELKREQLHSQKLELEKKKLEIRVEELETSLGLQSGMCIRPTAYHKASTLSRSATIGVGNDGRFARPIPRVGKRQPYKTGSLRRDGSLPNHPAEDTKNGRHQPRHRVVARLRELEMEREKISHQSSLLQFQLDAISAQREVAQSTGRSQGPGQLNGSKPARLGSNENGHRSSINDSLEKMSISSNGSSVSGSPPTNGTNDDDPFENGSPLEDSPSEDATIPETDAGPTTVNGFGTAWTPEFTASVFGTSPPLGGSLENGGSSASSSSVKRSASYSQSSEEDHVDGPGGRGVVRGNRSRRGSESLDAPHGSKSDSSRGHHSESFKVDSRFKSARPENSWEKYDTLKRRYEDLKKRRAQRLQQGGVFVAQDDMSSSPALQQRREELSSNCGGEVGLENSPPLVDC